MDNTIMSSKLLAEIKEIILNTVGKNSISETLEDDSELVGNLLDSLSITNLIAALEETFGFIFDDEDLSAEAFETPLTLAILVSSKIS